MVWACLPQLANSRKLPVSIRQFDLRCSWQTLFVARVLDSQADTWTINRTDMSSDKIDTEGFRANVGIILTNDAGQLLLAGRIGNRGWQFPQGGLQGEEDIEEAMYRELHEEIGLCEPDVEVLV